jgi:hypothetical protein
MFAMFWASDTSRGVNSRTSETASSALAESGQTVASDAEYQASCVEETSASLEGISTSTKRECRTRAEGRRSHAAGSRNGGAVDADDERSECIVDGVRLQQEKYRLY